MTLQLNNDGLPEVPGIITWIKCVRDRTGLPLQECKNLVDTTVKNPLYDLIHATAKLGAAIHAVSPETYDAELANLKQQVIEYNSTHPDKAKLYLTT